MVALFFLTALAFILMIRNLPFRAVIFPCFISAMILLNALIYSFTKVRDPSVWDSTYYPESNQETQEKDETQEKEIGPDFVLKNKTAVTQAFIAFFVLSGITFLLGQLYATPIFVTGYLWLKGENRILAILSGLSLWALIQFVFIGFMSLNMPAGYILALLGY